MTSPPRTPIKLLAATGTLAAAAALSAAPAGAAVPGASVEAHRLVISGTSVADTIALRTDAAKPKRLLVDFGDDGIAEHRVNVRAIDSVVVRGRRGDDRIHLDESQAALPASLAIRLHGGAGTDTVARSGSAGADAMEMAAAEGGLARLSNGDSHALLGAIEQVELPVGGGADSVGIFDLADTGVLGVATSAGPADGAADRVIAGGTAGDDAVEILGAPGTLALVGLPTALEVHDAEATDDLALFTASGDDAVSASTLPPGAIELSVDAGLGDDTVLGSLGADALAGGLGADRIDGQRGDDTASLGGSDDVFVWDPGDGSDTVDGGSGADAMEFNGANAAEIMAASAVAGGRLRFTRNVGNIVMDLASIEAIDVAALGGADAISVGDLSGTSTKAVDVELGGSGNPAGDGAVDTVNVAGTAGNDAVTVSGAAGAVTVAGLPAAVTLARAESTDQLVVDGGAGQDSADSTGLAPNTIGLTVID